MVDTNCRFFLETDPDRWTIAKFQAAAEVPENIPCRNKRAWAKGAFCRYLRSIANREPPFSNASEKMIQRAVTVKAQIGKQTGGRRVVKRTRFSAPSDPPPCYAVALKKQECGRYSSPSPLPLGNDETLAAQEKPELTKTSTNELPQSDELELAPLQLSNEEQPNKAQPISDSQPEATGSGDSSRHENNEAANEDDVPPTEILSDNEGIRQISPFLAQFEDHMRFHRADEHFIFRDGTSLENLILKSRLREDPTIRMGLVDLMCRDVVQVLGVEKLQELKLKAVISKRKVDPTFTRTHSSYPGDAIVLGDYGKHEDFFGFIKDILGASSLIRRPIGVVKLPSNRQLYIISEFLNPHFKRTLLYLEHQLTLNPDPRDLFFLSRRSLVNPPIRDLKFFAILTSVAKVTIYCFVPLSSLLSCFTQKSFFITESSWAGMLECLTFVKESLDDTQAKLSHFD